MELHDLLDSIQGESYIIGADLNGHHTSWGYNDTSTRGRAIEDMINAKQMVLINPVDAPPTFFHTKGTVGSPDLTLTSNKDIAVKLNWQVLNEETLSDHQYIKIEVKLERKTLSFLRFKTKYEGHNKFHNKIKTIAEEATEKIQQCNSKTGLDETNEIHLEIMNTCKSSYRVKKQEINKPQHGGWWSQDLEITKKKVGALRRRAQRAPADLRRGACIIYDHDRAEYRPILLETRRMVWNTFCTEVSNPHGSQYKSIFRPGRPPSDLLQHTTAEDSRTSHSTS
ncbi:hypothetical protein AVEN_54978-1 [Araneus ventricosus]|uniref:Endonuclease/exonuclease/phosphatase domain-containing protein n=1 Tax=Araneus ventricosus TaxID=182803 RepID=A0A4Y2RK12_ARAVE|nr:hypothetical protein AVEN_70663-1 [Araneus ventricosus]GBN60484.1 hypothetical protein AVEN_176762-1 [Araneus ventricosus]GBN75226.1 hypothetical protein AVEN_244121-1 [Araneus ventricosus]GBN75235.1 hypothetical protein AVEN_54978-1 [Araneus ventricosus]